MFRCVLMPGDSFRKGVEIKRGYWTCDRVTTKWSINNNPLIYIISSTRLIRSNTSNTLHYAPIRPIRSNTLQCVQYAPIRSNTLQYAPIRSNTSNTLQYVQYALCGKLAGVRTQIQCLLIWLVLREINYTYTVSLTLCR